MATDFLSVTELAGDEVSQEQVERISHRYHWAGQFCRGKDVVEAACGTGQGLGYIAGLAKSLRAGDFSEEILKIGRRHYDGRVSLQQFDAQDMPFENLSADIVILFEAIYYLPSAEKFVSECRRVLRNGGKVLIATANKDLYDFNPSPYSHRYYGVLEMKELFSSRGFEVEFFGAWPLQALSLRQRILRPVKKMAVRLNLMPKSADSKKWLKRIVFGSLVPMPAEITDRMYPYVEPSPLPATTADKIHKAIYCAATLHQGEKE